MHRSVTAKMGSDLASSLASRMMRANAPFHPVTLVGAQPRHSPAARGHGATNAQWQRDLVAAHLQFVPRMATGSADAARHFYDAVSICERLREANRGTPPTRSSLRWGSTSTVFAASSRPDAGVPTRSAASSWSTRHRSWGDVRLGPANAEVDLSPLLGSPLRRLPEVTRCCSPEMTHCRS